MAGFDTRTYRSIPPNSDLRGWSPTYASSTLFPGVVKTAVFDVDNTLVDSRAFHQWLWRAVGRQMVDRHLADAETARFQDLRGMIYTDIAVGLAEIFSSAKATTITPEAVVFQINDMFNGLSTNVPSDAPKIQEVPGAIRLVERVKKISEVTIYTGSYRSMIDYMFRVSNMPEVFNRLRTVEDMQADERKNQARGWLASMVKCAPSEAVAFEDTPSGVCGALAAGFYRVYVRPSVEISTFREPIVETLRCFPNDSPKRSTDRVVFLQDWDKVQFEG